MADLFERLLKEIGNSSRPINISSQKAYEIGQYLQNSKLSPEMIQELSKSLSQEKYWKVLESISKKIDQSKRSCPFYSHIIKCLSFFKKRVQGCEYCPVMKNCEIVEQEEDLTKLNSILTHKF